MRRTNQEFKEELEKRCQAYRREQVRKRKNLLTVGLCASICCVAVAVFDPFGAGSEAPMAADMIAAGELKNESAVMQDVGSDGLKPESNVKYGFGSSAPAEFAAAPMEPETNMSVTGDPGAAPSGSRLYNVVSIEVNTSPEHEEYWRFFTSKEKIVPIIVSLERFYPADDNLQEPEPMEGMAYEITVTYVNETVRYTLFGGGLSSDAEGWIRFDADAARKLETALAQESDNLSITVICGSEEITLDVADAAVIMGYLLSDQWIMSAANCLCDYTLEVNGKTYRYHSDCGTVQNESGQSLTLSEEDKAIFNDIVGRCPMRID